MSPTAVSQALRTINSTLGKAPAFNITQVGVSAIAKDDIGVFRRARVKGGVGGEVNNLVVIHFIDDIGVKVLVEPLFGLGNHLGQVVYFNSGVGQPRKGHAAIAHSNLMFAFGKGCGQDANIVSRRFRC